MSDDLVKRLRNTPNWMREGFQNWKDNVRTYDRAPFEAADRIEKLEADLAKAVEALEFYAAQDVTYLNVGTVRFHGHDDNGRKARATLAELTGGKDE